MSEEAAAYTKTGSSTTPRTEITPAYGMREVGGYGIRGYRVHCDCGHLGNIVSYRTAARMVLMHRRTHRA